jgi:hypothetical protein
MQSRLMSAIEAATNVIAGYAIAVLANIIVLPLFGFSVSPGQAAQIGVVFTALALLRSYALRRLFEAWR